MKKIKLSVVLATRNEEKNIGPCLETVKGIVDEIVIVDENSTDKTRQIAKKYGARVFRVKHEPIFHKTKQKALSRARGKWILQLDADERVTPALAKEIKEVVNSSNLDLLRKKCGKKDRLFARHQRNIERRDGVIGTDSGEVVAFFLPRLNFFLGKPLVHAGAYPDPAIRLVKKDKAYFPAKSVHEIMKIEGVVKWLCSDSQHHDSPTLARYLERANRYTTLTSREFTQKKLSKNIFGLFYYSTIKPLLFFTNLYIRHKGILDGMRGFLWSALSASHFPIAYYKYWTGDRKKSI